MGYFPVRYDSRVVIYECKMFIRLATGLVAKGERLSREVISLNPSGRIVFIKKHLRFFIWHKRTTYVAILEIGLPRYDSYPFVC